MQSLQVTDGIMMQIVTFAEEAFHIFELVRKGIASISSTPSIKEKSKSISVRLCDLTIVQTL